MNIRDAFEEFKKECEKYAKDGMTFAVIELKGFSWQKEVFTKLATIYNTNTEIDKLANLVTPEEIKLRQVIYHIMMMSIHNFKEVSE